jgi:hypothetical protein
MPEVSLPGDPRLWPKEDKCLSLADLAEVRQLVCVFELASSFLGARPAKVS